MLRDKYKVSGNPPATRIAAGIDVHKYKLQVFVLGFIFGKEHPLGEQVFKNDATGREELCKYLAGYLPHVIALEKTGVLSDPVGEALERFREWKEQKPSIMIVPTDTLKRFPGEVHTDSRSARGLAILAASGLLQSIFIPSKAGRQLRQLTRELDSLTKQSTSIINEIKDYLSGLGYTLPKFTLMSSWGLAFTKLLLMDGVDGNIKKLYDLVEGGHVSLHHTSKQAILEKKHVYMGYTHLSISRFDSRFIGRKIAMLAMIETEKDACAKHIEDHVEQYPILNEQVRRIEQLPGIGTAGAITIVAEVGDPSRFSTYKQFQLYVGRAIAPDESGESRGKPHMTKRCNHRLKRVFRHAGLIVSRSVKEDSDIRRYALRQRGKHPRNPSIAAANTSTKIARIVYKIMHDGIVYDPFHDTRSKNTMTSFPLPEEDPSWVPRLKNARERARRFKNFSRKTVDELPDGEMKLLLTKVLAAFDHLPG